MLAVFSRSRRIADCARIGSGCSQYLLLRKFQRLIHGEALLLRPLGFIREILPDIADRAALAGPGIVGIAQCLRRIGRILKGHAVRAVCANDCRRAPAGRGEEQVAVFSVGAVDERSLQFVFHSLGQWKGHFRQDQQRVLHCCTAVIYALSGEDRGER
ncbi:hypothetical protein D3C73_1295480 [compost metagenome]